MALCGKLFIFWTFWIYIENCLHISEYFCVCILVKYFTLNTLEKFNFRVCQKVSRAKNNSSIFLTTKRVWKCLQFSKFFRSKIGTNCSGSIKVLPSHFMRGWPAFPRFGGYKKKSRENYNHIYVVCVCHNSWKKLSLNYVLFFTDQVQSFLGNQTHKDHFKLLRTDGKSLLIGARNVVYNLSLDDLTENVEQVCQFF